MPLFDSGDSDPVKVSLQDASVVVVVDVEVVVVDEVLVLVVVEVEVVEEEVVVDVEVVEEVVVDVEVVVLDVDVLVVVVLDVEVDVVAPGAVVEVVDVEVVVVVDVDVDEVEVDVVDVEEVLVVVVLLVDVVVGPTEQPTQISGPVPAWEASGLELAPERGSLHARTRPKRSARVQRTTARARRRITSSVDQLRAEFVGGGDVTTGTRGDVGPVDALGTEDADTDCGGGGVDGVGG